MPVRRSLPVLALLLSTVGATAHARAQDYAAPADPPAAEREARAALRTSPAPGRARALNLLHLGRALDMQLRSAEAEPMLREARSIVAGLAPVDHDLARVADFYLADALVRLDRAADALPLARRALDALPAGDSLDRSYSCVQLAKALTALKQLDEAGRFAAEAYRIRKARLGDSDSLTLNALAALARIHAGKGDAAEAGRMFAAILDARKRLDDAASTIDAATEYGQFLSDQGRRAEAVPIFRDALERARRHAPDDRDLIAWRTFDLAKAIWQANAPGADATAEQLLREGLKSVDRQNDESARDLSEPLFILARILSDANRYGEADPLLARLIAAEEAGGDTETLWYANLLGARAHVLMSLGDGQTTTENPHHPEARRLLERQIAIIEKVEGPTARALALPLQRLAIILRWQRDPGANAAAQRALSVVPDIPGKARVEALYDSAATLDVPEAIKRIEAARTMLVSISGERDGYLFTIDERLAALREAAGDLDRAEELRRGILARRIAAGDRHGIARAQAILAILLVRRNKLDLAAASATDALRLLAASGAGESIEAGYATGTLAAIARRNGDLAAAERLTRAELAIYEARLPGGYARMIAATLTSLGEILIDRNQPAEAVPLLTRAAAIHARWFGPESDDVAYAWIIQARALGAAGEIEQARALFARSYALLARSAATMPGSTLLIGPGRDYAAFALERLDRADLARNLLRETLPLIVSRAARAGIDGDAAREQQRNRASLTLAVRANWALAAAAPATPPGSASQPR